jgi:hypothetical protein
MNVTPRDIPGARIQPLDPATMKRSRPKDNPYEIWEGRGAYTGWTWLVLKKYSKNEDDAYARAFCYVTSPFTYGSGDLGDVYIRDYQSAAVLVGVNP